MTEDWHSSMQTNLLSLSTLRMVFAWKTLRSNPSAFCIIFIRYWCQEPNNRNLWQELVFFSLLPNTQKYDKWDFDLQNSNKYRIVVALTTLPLHLIHTPTYIRMFVCMYWHIKSYGIPIIRSLNFWLTPYYRSIRIHERKRWNTS